MAKTLWTYIIDAEQPALNIRVAAEASFNITAAIDSVARYWGIPRDEVRTNFNGTYYVERKTNRLLAIARHEVRDIDYIPAANSF